ncbi:hypothetical protein B0H14DRAFT_2564021 [Mycena olivaceomarginata]|nr:hypothetical protein B0H14DRAFT_2564021 [Mycena olivaceomarginata]
MIPPAFCKQWWRGPGARRMTSLCTLSHARIVRTPWPGRNCPARHRRVPVPEVIPAPPRELQRRGLGAGHNPSLCTPFSLEFNVHGLSSAAQSPRPPTACVAPIPEFPARTVTSSHVGLGHVVMHCHAPPPPVKKPLCGSCQQSERGDLEARAHGEPVFWAGGGAASEWAGKHVAHAWPSGGRWYWQSGEQGDFGARACGEPVFLAGGRAAVGAGGACTAYVCPRLRWFWERAYGAGICSGWRARKQAGGKARGVHMPQRLLAVAERAEHTWAHNRGIWERGHAVGSPFLAGWAGWVGWAAGGQCGGIQDIGCPEQGQVVGIWWGGHAPLMVEAARAENAWRVLESLLYPK